MQGGTKNNHRATTKVTTMVSMVVALLVVSFVVIDPSEALSTNNNNNNKSCHSIRTTSADNTTKKRRIPQPMKDDDSSSIITNNVGGIGYNRRALLEKTGKTIAIASVGSVSPFVRSFTPFSYAAASSSSSSSSSKKKDDDFEVVIQQQTLLAGLSSAPIRTVIITGANSGVGLAGAKLLTAAGHRVILACRTKAKAEIAVQKCMEYAATSSSTDKFFSYRREGGSATAAECNLASLASIQAFANSMLLGEGNNNIDTLVLNAGLAHGQGEIEKVFRTVEGFEETVGVNHLGHFYLAHLLQPKLAKAKVNGGSNGRLVSTASPVHDPTSGGGDVGAPATLGSLVGMRNDGTQFTMVDGSPYDPDKAYKDSKLCNMLFMAEASRRYADSVTVNAFSPGLIADPNGFFRNQNKGFATVFNTITKVVGVAESNEFGGSALAYLAVDPAVAGKTGGWYDSAPPGKHQLAKHLPSTEAQNLEEQKLLWDLSSKLVGI
mmetsp:Transcript_43466/g.48703  ORF Transcript_43466/g.48703 Transcript_43466/m.48703 type:complete len:492 (-) Transcript_43466:24-1499(-)|eukprot:CAMPEP_0170822916 /NCGR_PEP_ID=MMETSP0733-20121128/44156_1 /TAXON_ID=186038 /ORGANISM="Fragilariopsis kerguelensis, Strain L26-C5" /LENGTH=491 /DNA_ID=CAMNT_0011185391 /DNA_START=154 /DNA_END=1629 /DNA_ORIENTATION=+